MEKKFNGSDEGSACSDQAVANNVPNSTEVQFFRYLGLSIFWYCVMLLVWSIIHGLFTGHFKWDISYLLLFWMAYDIKNGSLTACKWGVFFMSCYGIFSLVICFLLLVHPAWIEFQNDISPAGRPIYFVGTVIFVVWSFLNLAFLIRILKRHQARYWTKGVILGHAVIAVLIVCLMIPRIINTAQGYSATAIQTKYADVIEYLKKAARNEVSNAINAPEVVALSQAYPDIVSASIRTAKHSGQSIISADDFESRWGWSGGGAGTDREGNKIRYAEYKDYTKDQKDHWVEINLRIRITK